MSKSNYAENACINALLRNTALQVAAVYGALHTGDPGENGTNAEITAKAGYVRKQLTMGAPSDGVSLNTVAALFGPAGEDWGTIGYTSVWDNVSGGNCLYVSSAMGTPRAVGNGDSLNFAIGDWACSET